MTSNESCICFTVDNYEQVYSADPEALGNLEKALALAGAIPARVDEPDRIFCVVVTNPDLSIESILGIFSQFGYRAQLKGDC
jgi:hypothetical protein